MTIEEAFKIASAIIVSCGGSAAIIMLLSSWLGKVWASRILEQDRARYILEIEKVKTGFQKELESYKSQLEISRLMLERYSEKQLPLYNDIWIALYELKISADKLWSEANKQNLMDFASKLAGSESEIEKKNLLIEEEHYRQLKILFDKFWNFSIGKKKLIQIKVDNTLEITQFTLQGFLLVQENEDIKNEYDNLIEEIRKTFKKQLKGDLYK